MGMIEQCCAPFVWGRSIISWAMQCATCLGHGSRPMRQTHYKLRGSGAEARGFGAPQLEASAPGQWPPARLRPPPGLMAGLRPDPFPRPPAAVASELQGQATLTDPKERSEDFALEVGNTSANKAKSRADRIAEWAGHDLWESALAAATRRNPRFDRVFRHLAYWFTRDTPQQRVGEHSRAYPPGQVEFRARPCPRGVTKTYTMGGGALRAGRALAAGAHA